MDHAGGHGSVELSPRSVGVAHIVFFVVAAAAPLTAVVGTSPAAFAFGNGAGVPGTFVLAGLLYMLFSVGFAAMSRHVGGAGGFYVYLAQGIGRPFGAGGALVMLITYSATQIAIYALFGVFMADSFAPLGVLLPWWVWTLGAIGLVTLCGRRRITFSGNLLGLCMVGEVVILLLLDIAIILQGGPEGLSLSTFSPAHVFTPGLGTAMVFVVGSFVGFEATAIFSEEAKRPERTIPFATYTAVLLITCFYAFSTWAIAQYYGPSRIGATAAANIDTLFFTPSQQLLGGWSVIVMRVLLNLSLFACVLSLHNVINRYLFALGRDGMLPATCGQLHPRHHSPCVAGAFQSLASVAVVILFAVAGSDPYNVVFPWMSVLGVVGILMIQAGVCIAIIMFFRRDGHGIGVFSRVIAPALSALGLVSVTILVVRNIPLLARSDNPLPLTFPWLILLVGIVGIVHALRLKRTQPETYARLGQNFD